MARIGRGAVFAALAGVAVLAGCGAVPVSTPVPAPTTSATSPTSPTSTPATTSTTAPSCPWMGPGLTVPERVDELLAAMTPDQMIELMHLVEAGPDGLYESRTPAIPALCLPSVTEQDGSEGVAAGYSGRPYVHQALTGATELPSPITDAAAFDPSLARADGRVIGREEARAGVDVALAPMVNIDRASRWGRGYESLGEDPVLAASLGVALVDGIQSEHVAAVVKHFAAYNQEAHRGTRLDDSVVSERALQEIYLPAFAAVVQDAHPAGVMCSLNEVDGTPACQDRFLLQTVLRQTWGFEGFVRSDCGGVYSTVDAVDAGVSQVKCAAAYSPAALTAALANGRVTPSALAAAVRPLLTVLFAHGLLSAPNPFAGGRLSSRADRAVALREDDEGAVLLRNRRSLLPLPLHQLGSLALIGASSATPVRAGGGASTVDPTDPITNLAALRGVLGPRLRYCSGSDLRQAAALARQSDVAVVVVGLKEREGADLPTIALPTQEDRLVRAVEVANPRTVVVLETGGPVLMPWLDHAGAVLETWYPGQMAGPSLVDLLDGRADPSGKLPVTFPASEGEQPAATPATFGGVDGHTDYAEGIDVGYRWYEVHGVRPAFPFGFGLSYTDFAFSGLQVTGRAGAGLTVTATVTNIGYRAGAEVVQCYVGDPPSTGEPPRQLRGFQRVELAPGASRTVSFQVTPGDLASWHGATGQPGDWTVAPGAYHVFVGDSSARSALPLRATVQLGGADLGPDAGPTPVAGAR